MSDYRTLKTTISVIVPPQSNRKGLGRLETGRRRIATREAVAAFVDVMENYGIKGSVAYESVYSIDIDTRNVTVTPVKPRLRRAV